MSGNLQEALTSEERQRFDAALRNHAMDPARSPRRADPSRQRAMPAITRYEEHVWLAQQQAPGSVLKHVVACRLTGDPDLGRLATAIVTLVQACPDLDARYRFDADGELHKEAGPGTGALRWVRADSRDAAIALILDRQGAGWDSEREPPFEALLIAAPQETILALVLHRIIDAAHPAAGLLSGIADACAGRRVVPVRAFPLGTRMLRPDEAPALLPAWMHRSRTVDAAGIATCGERGPAPRDRAAGRFAASIPVTLLGEPAHDASERQVLARFAVAVARFVSAVTGSRAVDLLIGITPDGAIGDPSPAASHHRITLAPDDRASHDRLLDAVLTGLDRPGDARPMDDALPHRSENPTVSVDWRADVARILRIDGALVERLPLPTLEDRPDLAFAIGRGDPEAWTVELVTGQALSPHIGPVLLERFVVWLAEGEAALPGQPSPRPAVPAPDEGGNAVIGTSEDAVAALILAAFREALGAPEMGPDDDFFDHGGHSLIATRIIGRLLSHHGIELRFDDLFSFPTAAALARKARIHGASGAPAERGAPGNAAASAPLALAQASLWKAYAAFGFNEIFNLPFLLDFLDPVDEALFAEAFAEVMERHPGLRSLFRQEGGAVRQQVVPMAELARYRWFWTSRESAGVDRRDEARHRFDLETELPLRLRFLIDPVSGRQVLSFLFHHIALDEWSVNLMMDEIATAYRARAAGDRPSWSDIPAPFHAFAELQSRAGIDESHVAYWVDRLRGAPPPRPILDRDIGAPEADAQSAAGGWVEFKLDSRTADGLYALAKRTGASLFNVVYAGIAAALRQLGGLSELVVGTSASGRGDADFFDTIGYFTTVVAHRIRFDDGMSVGDLVARVKATINESMPYTGIPIDIVEEALGMVPGRDHLFEVFIQIHAKNRLNGALTRPDGGAIRFRQVDPERHESVLGLQFEVMEETIAGERAIRVLMNYRSAHYGPEAVARITATTGGLFALMAREDAHRLSLDQLGATLAAG